MNSTGVYVIFLMKFWSVNGDTNDLSLQVKFWERTGSVCLNKLVTSIEEPTVFEGLFKHF